VQFGFALGLEFLELPDHQAQPLVFARDLFPEPLRQRTTVTGAQAGKAFDEQAIERVDIANALAVQQALDAVAVRRALLDQTIPFTTAALAILLFSRRDADDAADPRLAAQVGEERPHQLLQIDPVGLGAPGTTVHLDAGRVDLMIEDTSSRQPSVQPVAVQACFVA
jgi:hypothetical protein